MFNLGKPLGWDESYRNKKYKQALFCRLISMNIHTYTNGKELFFSDVLDQITLFYVIRREVKSEMASKDIQMSSEDEGESDDDYESDFVEVSESEMSLSLNRGDEEQKKNTNEQSDVLDGTVMRM